MDTLFNFLNYSRYFNYIINFSEAFYGISGQKEGENIGTRTSNARKQYPSKLFGFTRIEDKEKGQVRFIIDEF